MSKEKIYMELPEFTGRNVPVTEIAKAMHKDAQYVRVGIQQGIFKFGYVIKLENSNEYNYYCPDRKVWEEIGYFKAEWKRVLIKIMIRTLKWQSNTAATM